MRLRFIDRPHASSHSHHAVTHTFHGVIKRISYYHFIHLHNSAPFGTIWYAIICDWSSTFDCVAYSRKCVELRVFDGNWAAPYCNLTFNFPNISIAAIGRFVISTNHELINLGLLTVMFFSVWVFRNQWVIDPRSIISYLIQNYEFHLLCSFFHVVLFETVCLV